MFGLESNESGDRRKFLRLASDLEFSMQYSDAHTYNTLIHSAAQLRNLLRSGTVPVTEKEREQAIQLINRAKVKAFMSSTPDSYRTFMALDTISKDLL
ncbi:hypothetical protein KKF81_00775 [Candidatus Micrarchaeota archaeon]|nr:hypothetical protein [Candidatus Micrarchaeota archaeon]MBU1165453.1 hypothetical protein [Candidatus Micrarchaeota archaeon]MBU1887434.1 hypothetical protein [Candidatus Micrarchaeota archaeon]